MFAHIFSDVDTVRAATAINVDLMRNYAPDVVVDSFGLFACMAARILRVPLVTVNQGNFHPASDGFIWWAGPRPVGLPSPVLAVNKVLSEYGVAPVARSVDLFAGALSLITGTPETDPVTPSSTIEHVGQILWQRGSASLPDSIADLSTDKPLIWVYAGNPRYFGPATSTPFDSIVVIRAAIAALGEAPVHVVLTTGYQDLPEEFGTLPSNFQMAAYLPGLAMARRSDLMINHGGHSSYMTALSAGTPAVIIPTSSERESNARRLAALGAGEFVLPIATPDGEKQIDIAVFREKVVRVIGDPSYRTSARRIADSMRPYGGAAQAADRIESLVPTKA
jgi:UDP:flavonoid glycosyltransferase YjiC (YdhE family)